MTAEKQVGQSVIRVVRGDITDMEVEAFIHDITSDAKLGTGYGGAITARGGKAVQDELDTIGSCPTGQAIVTAAGRMPVEHIIHVNGPKFHEEDQEGKLRSAVKAALAIADRDGLGGLTIRKLAERLGVSPMATYRYFRNKAEIVEGLVDVVVGEYDVTNHEEADWAKWVRKTFCLMRRALREHPGIITLLGTAASSGPNAMAVMEEVLTVRERAGIAFRSR